MDAVRRALLTAIKFLLTVLAAVVLVIEEWGWRPLTAMAARIARWPPLARLEQRITSASPRIALALFLVPAAMLFPLKLLALLLINRHHAWLGILLIIGAKLVGTALVGRLFIICEPQLMTFPWFARAIGWWRATKLRVRSAVMSSAAWRAAQRFNQWIRARCQRWRQWWRRGYDR